jgi:hypothetical protein
MISIGPGLTISEWYLGIRSSAFFMAAACAALSSLGGGVVRVATGTPPSLQQCNAEFLLECPDLSTERCLFV